MSDPTVAALCRFIPKFLHFLRAGPEASVSPARIQAMQALAAEETLPMAELAARLSVTKRAVTSLVDAMERDGLAERRPHPTDRRVKLVAITDKGAALHRQAVAAQNDRIDALLEGMSADDRRALAEALDRVSEALDARRSQA